MKNIFKALDQVIDQIPVLNLLPILKDQINRIPEAYESMSDEEKTEFSKNLLKAAARAAADYGSGQ